MDNSSLIITSLVALIIAMLGAIPPSIIAYAAWQQGRRNGDANKEANETVKGIVTKNDAKTDDIAHRAEEIVKQTNAIHQLTDGNLTKVQTELAMALQEMKNMRELINTLIEKNTSTQQPNNPKLDIEPLAVSVDRLETSVDKLDAISEITGDTQARVEDIQERAKVIQEEVTKEK